MWHKWPKDVLQLALGNQVPAGAADLDVEIASVTMSVSPVGLGVVGVAGADRSALPSSHYSGNRLL